MKLKKIFTIALKAAAVSLALTAVQWRYGAALFYLNVQYFLKELCVLFPVGLCLGGLDCIAKRINMKPIYEPGFMALVLSLMATVVRIITDKIGSIYHIFTL